RYVLRKAMLNKLRKMILGCTDLTPFEEQSIKLCIDNLPENLKGIAAAQFKEYNLIQREYDGRTVNFYKVKCLRKVVNPNQLLPIKTDDCVLIKLELKTISNERIGVTLHATGHRIFSASFSKDVSNLGKIEGMRLEKLTKSWRSVV
ncbi:hypothetical protein, partial [Vibrio harveyi]